MSKYYIDVCTSKPEMPIFRHAVYYFNFDHALERAEYMIQHDLSIISIMIVESRYGYEKIVWEIVR